MSTEANREIGEYLLEDRGGIMFETSGTAVAAIEAALAERGLLDDSGVLTRLDRSRSMVDRLAVECDELERQNRLLEGERDDLVLRLERALAELSSVKEAAENHVCLPCWRCGGAA